MTVCILLAAEILDLASSKIRSPWLPDYEAWWITYVAQDSILLHVELDTFQAMTCSVGPVLRKHGCVWPVSNGEWLWICLVLPVLSRIITMFAWLVSVSFVKKFELCLIHELSFVRHWHHVLTFGARPVLAHVSSASCKVPTTFAVSSVGLSVDEELWNIVEWPRLALLSCNARSLQKSDTLCRV